MPNQTPSVTLDPNSPNFGTPDDAADAVSKNFGGDQKYEQAAVLIQRPDGSYGYSTLAPQRDHDNFSLQAALPKGHKLAGIVHSHPGADEAGQFFSPHDLDVADQLKVPSFVRFLKDDSVRKYTPGRTRTSFMRQPGTAIQGRVTKGDPLEQSPAPAAQAAQGPISVKVEGNSMSGPVGTVGEGGAIGGNPNQGSFSSPVAGPPQDTAAAQPNPVAPPPPPNATVGTGTGSNDPSANLTVPPLGTLTPQNPGAATYGPTDAGPAATATATPVGMLTAAQTAQQAQIAQLQPGQGDSTNAADQLNAITSENSPYMQLAKQQGLLTAAGRGLENSSLAAGSSEAAATAAAAPLAEQNAAGATQSSLQEQQLATQTSEFNSSQDAAAKELSAQLGTSVSQSNAQLQTSNNQFNAQQKQASDAANAAATNTMAAQTAALTEDMNKQDLSGTQAARLAQIQADSNQLIASNQAASSMYSNFMTSMSATLANQNISPSRAAETITAMQSMLQSGLGVIDAMNGMNLDLTMPNAAGPVSGYNSGYYPSTGQPVVTGPRP